MDPQRPVPLEHASTISPASPSAPITPTGPRRPSPAGGARFSPRLDARLHRSYRTFFAMRQWLWRHITPAGALMFWAMLAAGSFTDTQQTMAHQIFGVLLCLIATSLISVRKPRSKAALTRQLPRQATAGVAVSCRVRLRNLTRRELRGLEFWEGAPDPRPTLEEFSKFAEPGESERNWFDRRYRFYRWVWLCMRNTRVRISPVSVPTLPPEGEAEISYEITPLRRGRLILRGAEVARTDPLGLFRRFGRVEERTDSLLVLPRRHRLPPMQLPGQSHRLHAGGVAMAGSVGDSEEFVSVRDYRPGDPMRRIHWTGWARIQRPVVKEFQEEFFVRHALVLDTFAGGPEADAFEDAVSLAASFAATVDERDSLLDLMFVGNQAYVFTAGRGLAHGEQMLEILAGVDLNPEGDPGELESLVLQHLGHLSGCILVLLDWDPARKKLRECIEAHRIPTLTFVVHRLPRPADPSLPAEVHWLQAGHVEEGLRTVSTGG